MAFAAALSPIHCRHPVRLSGGFSHRVAGADSPHAAPRAPKNPNKSWEEFYKRHNNKVGCGAGNTIFPLRLAFPDVFVHACDFSQHAIALVKEHEAFSSDRVNAFVCDVTEDDLCKTIMPASVDIVTMLMCLCIHMRLIIGKKSQEKLADKNQKISENFYARGDGTVGGLL